MGKQPSPQPNSTRRLAQQLSTWRSLRNRKQLIAQAEQLARADVAALTGDQTKTEGGDCRSCG